MSSYRSCTDFKEILRVLQKSTSCEETFLWQSNNGNRLVVPVQFLEIDFIAREVIIIFETEKYPLNLNLPFYVNLAHSKSAFKISEVRQSHQGALHFPFPDLIKMPELRSFERRSLSGSKKFVNLRSFMFNVAKDILHEQRVKLMDISAGGMAVLVPIEQRNFLKNNRILWVSAMDDTLLKDPILAEIVYISTDVEQNVKKTKEKLLKVGIKLSTTLDQDFLTKFYQ
jgi:hypothetical protein